MAAHELLEQISDAGYALDAEGNFVLVNEQAALLLGKTRSEMLGRNCWELFPEAVTAGLKDQYEQVIAAGAPVTAKVHYPSHGRWYDVRAQPAKDGVLVLFHDDTPSIEQERRNKVLVERALDGITIIHPDFVPLYRSPVNERLLGYAPVESGPIPIHPEDEREVKSKVQALGHQEAVTLEYRVQHADGHWLWVQGTFTNYLADPAVGGVVINFRDITKKVELREESQRQQAALLQSNVQQEVQIARLATLHQAHLSSVADDDVATKLRAILNSAINGRPAMAYCYLEATDEMHGVSHQGLAVAASAMPRSLVRSLTLEALNEGELLHFNPKLLVSTDEDFQRFRRVLVDGCVVPFERRDVRGAVVLVSAETLDLDQHAGSFLTTLAGYAGSAVATARLVEDLERSAADYKALANFGMRIETVHDLDTLMNAGFSELLDHLEIDNGGLADVVGDQVIPRWRMGRVPQRYAEVIMKPIPLDRGAVAEAVRTGEPVLVSKYRDYLQRPEHLEQIDFTSVLAVPIDAGSAGQYVIILTSFSEERPIDETDVAIATLYANRIGNALERLSYIEEVEASREATFRALGLALEFRDFETKGHTDRVASLTTRLAQSLGMNGSQVQAVQWGAYLHDLGKLSLPDHILFKPDALTEAEFEIIKTHPVTGEEMCRGIPFLPPETLAIVRHHHERFDGTGYPDGLAGEDIPFGARLFALVDVYDALRSDRPYRKARDAAYTFAYLREQAGKHFDPELTDEFLRIMADLLPAGQLHGGGPD